MSDGSGSSIMVCHCAILLLKVPSSNLTSRFAHISRSLPWAHVGMAGVGCCDRLFYVSACLGHQVTGYWVKHSECVCKGVFGGD